MYRLCSQSATATARRRSATSTRRWRTCRSAWTSTASGEGAESASGVGTTRRGSTARAVLPGSSGRLRCATCHPYVAFHHRSLNVTHLSFLCVCVCSLVVFSPDQMRADDEDPCVPCSCDSRGSVSQTCMPDSSQATPSTYKKKKKYNKIKNKLFSFRLSVSFSTCQAV